MQGVKDWTIDCLKEPEMGCLEGEGGENQVLREQMKRVKDWAAFRSKLESGDKKTTLRVIELSSARSSTGFHLGAVKVEEYKV